MDRYAILLGKSAPKKAWSPSPPSFSDSQNYWRVEKAKAKRRCNCCHEAINTEGICLKAIVRSGGSPDKPFWRSTQFCKRCIDAGHAFEFSNKNHINGYVKAITKALKEETQKGGEK
jgi:hypothetical protein